MEIWPQMPAIPASSWAAWSPLVPQTPMDDSGPTTCLGTDEQGSGRWELEELEGSPHGLRPWIMAGTSNKSIPDVAIFGMAVSTRGLELFRCFMLFLSMGKRVVVCKLAGGWRAYGLRVWHVEQRWPTISSHCCDAYCPLCILTKTPDRCIDMSMCTFTCPCA